MRVLPLLQYLQIWGAAAKLCSLVFNQFLRRARSNSCSKGKRAKIWNFTALSSISTLTTELTNTQPVFYEGEPKAEFCAHEGEKRRLKCETHFCTWGAYQDRCDWWRGAGCCTSSRAHRGWLLTTNTLQFLNPPWPFASVHSANVGHSKSGAEPDVFKLIIQQPGYIQVRHTLATAGQWILGNSTCLHFNKISNLDSWHNWDWKSLLIPKFS